MEDQGVRVEPAVPEVVRAAQDPAAVAAQEVPVVKAVQEVSVPVVAAVPAVTADKY